MTMSTPEKSAIILVVGFVAALISSMSGGGSSMIATPIALALGYPLPVVIASNVCCGSMWTLIAARNYLRGHELDRKLAIGLMACGLIGAYFGTGVIMGGDSGIIKRVFGIIILSLVLFTFLKKDFGVESRPPKLNRIFTSACALPLGFYEAFFGSGNGIFTSAMLSSSRGFKMLEALGYYYLISFVWCVFSASVYISHGNWDLTLIIPAVIGSMGGATVGSRIGSKKGAKFVKTVFIIAGTILGLKLALGV